MSLWILVPLVSAVAAVTLWAINAAIDEIVRMRIERYRLLGILPPEEER